MTYLIYVLNEPISSGNYHFFYCTIQNSNASAEKLEIIAEKLHWPEELYLIINHKNTSLKVLEKLVLHPNRKIKQAALRKLRDLRG